MGQLTEAERLASCPLLVSLRVALTEGLFITLLLSGKCLQGMSDAVGGKLNRTLSRLQQTNMPRVTHFDTDMGGLSFAPNGHRGHAASNASLLAPRVCQRLNGASWHSRFGHRGHAASNASLLAPRVCLLIATQADRKAWTKLHPEN
ncbi:hypothetical protein HYE68_000330 [Fusarium pseudograminearum]|nr:hypothetical protein HYE68_000330 [Fusarium pseudograminearum]